MTKRIINNVQEYLTIVQNDGKQVYQIVNIELLLRRHPPEAVIYGVKDYPVMPYGLFTLFADSFNLGIPKVFKMVVIIGVKFMFSHFDFLLLVEKCSLLCILTQITMCV